MKKCRPWLRSITVDDRKFYLAFPDCPIRLVYEDNEYVGWYYAGEVE